MGADHSARLLDALLRADFANFARAAFVSLIPGTPLEWNWHLDAICYQLERVRRSEIKRLIIEVPPRSLKSFLASIAFPAYCMGHNPGMQIIAASYSLELAIKLSNDFRALVSTPRYRRLFPAMVGSTKDTETEFGTVRRGYRYATSNGGTLTGRGADLIILDDPMRSDDAGSDLKRVGVQDWYRNTVYTRLNSKRDGAIILVMQRLHIDDLAGHLREQEGWTILSLPAIATTAERIEIGPGQYHERRADDLLHPVREPRDVLDNLRATMGSYNFSAQYQQEPIPVDGELVKWKWFRRYKEVPDRDSRIVQSWDVAVKPEQVNDFSVCTTWAIIGNNYYLLDVYRARLAFPDLKRQAADHCRKWRASSLIIEDKASGSALIQQLNSERLIAVPRAIPFNPKLDKVSRMSAESATIEAGQVLIPEVAPWLADLRSELAQFPHGRHDDQVDSISQFLTWARSHRSPDIGSVRVR